MRGTRRTRLLAACLLLFCVLAQWIPAGAIGSVVVASTDAPTDAPADTPSAPADTPEPTVLPTATPAPVKDLQYPGLTMDAAIGYDGAVTYLRKMPVQVSLSNSGPDLAGLLKLKIFRDELQYDLYELPVTVASGAEVRLDMPVELTMKQRQYRLELYLGEECVASRTVTPSRVMDPATILVATLSNGPKALSQFTISQTKDPLKRGELWQPIALTAESFPRDAQMLEAFQFLAVDGFDPKALDAAQQSALRKWLEEGGVAVVGGGAGGAAAYPFFEPYTGIRAAGAFQAEDATPALLTYVKSTEKALGESMMLTRMEGAKNVVVKTDVPLLDLAAAKDGYVLTAAFSLSDKPLDSWQSGNMLWQRLFLSAIGDRYQQIASFQQNYYSRQQDYIDMSVMNGIDVANDGSFLAPLFVLLLFVGLVGFFSYWLLKTRDRREWMWATVPVLSIVFALVMMLIGNWTSFKRPVAVVADYISQDEEGLVSEKAAVSLTMAEAEPMRVSVQNGAILMSANDITYYDPGETVPPEPNKLRYIYRQGENASITFVNRSTWNTQSFFVKSDKIPGLKVDAQCWWEEDGLMVRLANQSDIPLEKGYIMTNLGYISVPEVLPGQTVELLLKNPKAETPLATQAPGTTAPMGNQQNVVYNGNGNVPVMDGQLLSKTQLSAMNMYSIVTAMVYPEQWTDSKTMVPAVQENERLERSRLESRLYYCLNKWDWYNNANIYHYVVLNDDLADFTLDLNGQPVRRMGQNNVVDIALKYKPISDTGLARFTKGTIPVCAVEIKDDKTMARGPVIEERYRYYRLADKPVFCFVLPKEAQSMKLTGLDIGTDYAYSGYTMSVYNEKTAGWTEIDISKELKDQIDLKTFMNKEGEIFVQFALGVVTDYYAEMNTPYMTLDGRVQ